MSRSERLNSLYRREMNRLDAAIMRRDQDSTWLHMKRCSRLIKAMKFSSTKGVAA